MAETNFKTRHLPQSHTQASNAVEMAAHLQATDPHHQYVTRAEWNGGSGSIVLDAYVLTTTYNTFVSGYTNWKTNSADPAIATVNALSTWKTGIDTWKTNTVTPAITTVGELSTWKTQTADPAIQDITQLRSDLNALDSTVGDHLLSTYAQDFVGVIPFHKDNTGNELYARRLHTHTASDVGASPVGHDHDEDYLKINDIYNSRQTTDGVTVPALDDRFAPNSHSHGEYVTYTELDAVGIYRNANNPYIDPDNIVTNIDLNDYTSQGIYSIHPGAGQSVTNAPADGVNGTLIVLSADETVGDNTKDETTGAITITTAGVFRVNQIFLSDHGIIRNRTITETDAVAYAWVNETEGTVYTKVSTAAANTEVYTSGTFTTPIGNATAGNASTLTYGGNVYTRTTMNDAVGTEVAITAWTINNAQGRVQSIVNSGSAYSMDCSLADVFNITLNANCTLNISKCDVGQVNYLYVTTNGTYTLTYNGVVLLSTDDSGLFRIEFQNRTGAMTTTPSCIGVAVILA